MTDRGPEPERIYSTARETLLREGAGHALFAGAPSWNGRWLTALSILHDVVPGGDSK